MNKKAAGDSKGHTCRETGGGGLLRSRLSRIASSLRNILLSIMLSVGCFPLTGCAAVAGMDKAPLEIWERLTVGEPQDLIVVFDDSQILAQASQLNQKKGIIFDDNNTLRFKAERYAAIKRDAIASLPAGECEVLTDYDVLPLIFLRFRSVAALKALLANPSVLRAYEDKKENMAPLTSSRPQSAKP